MLRLAEHENKELKNSLRYVEIQLAKSRENYKMLTQKYEDAQADIQSGQEQIARQSNINHAQAEQIKEMGSKLDNVAEDQREMFEKSKAKMQAYQNEIDMREAEIQKLKKQNEQQTDDIKMYELRLSQMNERMQDIEEELELKSGENNRLRNQVADLEKSVMDLYGSRKGEGSIHVELNNMKADVERLINLLKDTSDYQDLDDVEILRKAKYLSQQNIGVICSTFGIESKKKGNAAKNKNLADANEWIPTQAVKKIKEIQAQFEGKMTETCISQILYEFNLIWRNIMRKENAAIKRKFTLQVQDLRRQLVTKKAFDEDVSQREISRLKKELAFVNMQLYNNKRQEFQKESAPGGSDNQMKIAQAMQDQKKALETENENLRHRIGQLEIDHEATY